MDVTGGRIAYEMIGQGPLVVLSHGMGDNRSAYRFLAPLIANPGYRVASVDLRGHGQSSTGWGSYTHAESAGDLMEVIRKLGGPAVIVGQSFSGGVATIAAAKTPDLVSAIVEIGPFTRPPKISVAALLRNAHHRRGSLLLVRFLISGSVNTWSKYLDVAYPGLKPAHWDTWLAALQANMREPGRMKALQKHGWREIGGRRRATGQRPMPGAGDHGQQRSGLAGARGRGRRDRWPAACRSGPVR